MHGIIVRYRSQGQSNVGREMNSPKTKGNIRNCAARRNNSLAELHGYRRAGTSGEQTIDKGVLRGSRRGDDTVTLGSCPRQRAGRTWRLSVIRTAGCAQEKCSWHFEIIQRECVKKNAGWEKHMRAEKNRPSQLERWLVIINHMCLKLS